MKVLVLRSLFQSDDFVKTEYAELISRLEKDCGAEITIISESTDWKSKCFTPDYLMIATGGVESLFKNIFVGTWCAASKQSISIIADGRNNSLAAALEILTYLEEQGNEGRIIHGTNDEIMAAIRANVKRDIPTVSSKLRGTRIGLFGYPSDWLIASGVDYDYLREYYGVESVYIDLQRLIDGIISTSKADAEVVAQEIKQRVKMVKEPNEADMIEAAKAYLVIKKICQEERLDAMTIRCFDIVKACDTTSCLALALLNDEGIVAGCEGDMQTLLTMILAKRLFGEEAFMANPSQLTDHTTMFAHCTIPLAMCDEAIIRSHFESGIGVAIQGAMPQTDYTIFKWGGQRLDRFFVADAKAIKNEYSNHFCRTQITLDINLKPYLLNHSIGNHHVIIKGRHADEIRRFMKENGITSFLASRRP